MEQNANVRYPRAFVSAFTISQLHLKNPYIAALWSLLTPGLGSLLLEREIVGLTLIIWGMVVNVYAHINVAVAATFTGNFDLAKQALDKRCFLLYIAVYVFSAWDAYRATMDLNKLSILADREDAPVRVLEMRTLDMNYLDRRSPALAAAWSTLTPGLGNLYLHKIIPGLFFVAWTILIAYYSHALPAVNLCLTGQFDAARAALDKQWLLFFPGVYGFGIYQSYASAVEYNKLFDKAQSKWLRDHYQSPLFRMPRCSQTGQG